MVVSKYIENPLTVDSHKMDLRMWVLITDFDPLTVWVFDDLIVRLTFFTYDPDENDLRAHLTNVAFVKPIIKE